MKKDIPPHLAAKKERSRLRNYSSGDNSKSRRRDAMEDEDEKQGSLPSTPSSPSKRQKTDMDIPVPSPSSISSKWARWEDKMILEAMLSAAEKVVDWRALAQDINADRLDQRTLNGIKLHWRSQKAKLLE